MWCIQILAGFECTYHVQMHFRNTNIAIIPHVNSCFIFIEASPPPSAFIYAEKKPHAFNMRLRLLAFAQLTNRALFIFVVPRNAAFLFAGVVIIEHGLSLFRKKHQ